MENYFSLPTTFIHRFNILNLRNKYTKSIKIGALKKIMNNLCINKNVNVYPSFAFLTQVEMHGNLHKKVPTNI